MQLKCLSNSSWNLTNSWTDWIIITSNY